MPTASDRKVFEEAIEQKSEDQIRLLLQRDDARRLLLMNDYGYLPIHRACSVKLSKSSLQLFLDAAVHHEIAQRMLEETTSAGSTCLHCACTNSLPFDSLQILLEYLSKHTDFRMLLGQRDNNGWTCLHMACRDFLPTDCLRLLISFIPSKDLFTRVLDARDYQNQTPVEYAEKNQVKQLLRDPDCFEKCRLWLLRNHEDTFLYSLFPNSCDKTCQALKELKDGLEHSQQHATIILIALMPSSSKFREAVDKTDSSAAMDSYFNVVKRGDAKSDYSHWKKNIHLFREFYGQWPPNERKTATTYEGEGSSSCLIQ